LARVIELPEVEAEDLRLLAEAYTAIGDH
jgi:hypothetical protein